MAPHTAWFSAAISAAFLAFAALDQRHVHLRHALADLAGHDHVPGGHLMQHDTHAGQRRGDAWTTARRPRSSPDFRRPRGLAGSECSGWA